MSFVSSIIARLGLDSAGFKAGLADASRTATNAHDQMGSAARRNVAANEDLLLSNHRVARQIQNFSRDVLSGADATTIFSSGLEGLERALKLPLGALAGLGIGAVGIVQIGKIVDEFKELQKEIEKTNETPLDPFHQAASQLDQLRTKSHDLSEKIKSDQTGIWNFVKRQIADAVNLGADAFKNLFNNKPLPEKTGNQLQKDLGTTQQTEANIQTAQIQQLARKNDLHGQPDFVSKAAAIEEKFFDTVERFGQRGVVELERELANLAADIAKTRRERAQTSLDEIAKRPDLNQDNSISIQAASEGQRAREAQKEIELANQARETIGGQAGLEQAQIHLNRADELKNGIDSLKDSDKDLTGQFKGALDSSSVLGQIKDELRRINFDSVD